MLRLPLVGRSLLAVCLLCGLIATVATTGVAAQADDVTLTIHVLDCPTTAEGDIFKACHNNRIKNADFKINGDDAESNNDGLVSVTVPAGDVDIEEVDFDTIATAGKAIVYCSPQPGGKPLSDYPTTDGDVTITGDAGTEVHCDWYNRTAPAAKITIHALECPIDAEGDIFEVCHDNRLTGVDFDIDGVDATSNGDGVAAANITAGEVTIEELDFDILATAGKAYVHCSIQPGGSPVLTAGNTTDGDVTIDVPANAEVHCDWYNRTSATGPTATSEPSETPEPTNTPQPTSTSSGGSGSSTATATATTGTSLPDTGVGPIDGTNGLGPIFGLALIVLAITGVGYSMRRRPA